MRVMGSIRNTKSGYETDRISDVRARQRGNVDTDYGVKLNQQTKQNNAPLPPPRRYGAHFRLWSDAGAAAFGRIDL